MTSMKREIFIHDLAFIYFILRKASDCKILVNVTAKEAYKINKDREPIDEWFCYKVRYLGAGSNGT